MKINILAYICSLHFDADAYCKPLIESLLNYSPRQKLKLKSDAVPTLKLSKLSYDNSSKTTYSLETRFVYNCIILNSMLNCIHNYIEGIGVLLVPQSKKRYSCR